MYSLVKKLFPLCLAMLVVTSMSVPTQSFANEANDERSITLPTPEKAGGMPLMLALAERKTTRTLGDTPLDNQQLSNILWTGYGINRKDGKRTIPTAKNKQNVALYVYMKGAIWIYDAETHAVHKLIESDLAGKSKGAITLIIAAEGDAKSDAYGNMHAGSIYQNVGLFCASANLGNVVHASGASNVQEILAPYLPTAYTVRVLQSIGQMK